MRKERKDVSCASINRKFNLQCTPKTVKKHIFKPMKWQYYLRSRKPAVPAGRGTLGQTSERGH